MVSVDPVTTEICVPANAEKSTGGRESKSFSTEESFCWVDESSCFNWSMVSCEAFSCLSKEFSKLCTRFTVSSYLLCSSEAAVCALARSVNVTLSRSSKSLLLVASEVSSFSRSSLSMFFWLYSFNDDNNEATSVSFRAMALSLSCCNSCHKWVRLRID